MMLVGQYTIVDDNHAEELIRLGFKPTLCTSPEGCENLLNHCKQHNMKFLKNSYGTLVHKEFNKYFQKSESKKMWKQLKNVDNWYDSSTGYVFDHTNLFRYKLDKDIFILTSSPYGSMDSKVMNELREHPCDVYVIHPNFLDYLGFVEHEDTDNNHPLYQVNYAFTNASEEQMNKINHDLKDGIGLYKVFIKVA